MNMFNYKDRHVEVFRKHRINMCELTLVCTKIYYVLMNRQICEKASMVKV